jgi:DNA-binding CsgD family transcriptional regulator
MYPVELTLTSANVERSVDLWADRSAYSPDELDRVLGLLGRLFARRCAHGTIITINGVTRACGLSAFVHADVLDAAIPHPLPLLTKRLLLAAAADSRARPFLEQADIARGNARDGLHLLILQANIDTSTGHGDVLFGQLTRAFYRLHDGYRPARVVADYVGPVAVAVARAGEFDIVREFPSIAPGIDIPSALVVLTPAAAAARGNTTIQTFAYNPPRIMFTAREQELLRCALDGAPDDIVAGRLGVALSSVKARWTRVQQRAIQMVPELFLSVPLPKQPHRRGAQTRHLVLQYVRTHPSELTPYLRDGVRAASPPVARARRQLDAASERDQRVRAAAADVKARSAVRGDPEDES